MKEKKVKIDLSKSFIVMKNKEGGSIFDMGGNELIISPPDYVMNVFSLKDRIKTIFKFIKWIFKK